MITGAGLGGNAQVGSLWPCRMPRHRVPEEMLWGFLSLHDDLNPFTHPSQRECPRWSGWPWTHPAGVPAREGIHPELACSLGTPVCPVGPTPTNILYPFAGCCAPKSITTAPHLWNIFSIWAAREFLLQFPHGVLTLGQFTLSETTPKERGCGEGGGSHTPGDPHHCHTHCAVMKRKSNRLVTHAG